MQQLSGVTGHDTALEVLSRMISGDSLPHALLLVGPESVGKTTIAHKLFRQVLDYTGDLATHPDVHILERLVDKKTEKKKTQISVAQVRELTARVSMSSMMGSYKVVFIEEAHMLSSAAANALLKTLEEPKGDVLFILRATTTDQLPATIVSRCQVLRLHAVSRETIIEGLKKMGYGATDATTAAGRALGRPGRAIRFLKDSEYRSELETGIAQAVVFLEQDLAGRLGTVLELIPKKEVHKKERLLVLLDQWELVFRDILLESFSCDDARVLQDVADVSIAGRRFTSDEIVSLLERIANVRQSMRYHVNPHLALEHISLGIS
jgi:DNA polymerase III subunit delta'